MTSVVVIREALALARDLPLSVPDAHVDRLRRLDELTMPAAPTDGRSPALYAVDQLRELLTEADSFISHMLYRRTWPEEIWKVEALIARLRAESES